MSYLEYSPIQIINILLGYFLPYRNLALIENEHNLSNDNIINDMKNMHHIKINAKKINDNSDRNIVTFLILSTNGKYSHSPELRKLLENNITNSLNELILIAEEIFFTKKILLDIIKDYQKNEHLENQPIFNAYPYYNFVTNIPKVSGIPPHRIISDEEIKQDIFIEYIRLNDLKVIFTSDPPIVWLGGKEGQIVEIQRYSSTSGIAIDYRRIERRMGV